MMSFCPGFRLLAAAIVVLVSTGCGTKSSFEFDALDLVPPQEELTEFPLGEYRIPIPVVENRGKNQLVQRNRFQLDFNLFALVPPEKKSTISDVWGRHEGKIRDGVIRVCRSASVEELQEPELDTLKGRLMDALAAHMGENEVRQLLITEVASQRL